MKLIVFKPTGDSDLPSDAILRSVFKVGRFTCELMIDCGLAAPGRGPVQVNMLAKWAPSVPRKLNKHALDEYRAGRNALYGMAANVLRGNVLLAEL
jgi:hypothetical protein